MSSCAARSLIGHSPTCSAAEHAEADVLSPELLGPPPAEQEASTNDAAIAAPVVAANFVPKLREE